MPKHTQCVGPYVDAVKMNPGLNGMRLPICIRAYKRISGSQRMETCDMSKHLCNPRIQPLQAAPSAVDQTNWLDNNNNGNIWLSKGIAMINIFSITFWMELCEHLNSDRFNCLLSLPYCVGRVDWHGIFLLNYYPWHSKMHLADLLSTIKSVCNVQFGAIIFIVEYLKVRSLNVFCTYDTKVQQGTVSCVLRGLPSMVHDTGPRSRR